MRPSSQRKYGGSTYKDDFRGTIGNRDSRVLMLRAAVFSMEYWVVGRTSGARVGVGKVARRVGDVHLTQTGRMDCATTIITMSQSTREVIQEWADGEGGYTFERGRMEAAVRLLCFKEPVSLHKDASSSTKVSQKPNKDDVEFLVRKNTYS